MSRNVLVAIVVVLLLAVGGWLLTRPQQPTTTQPQPTSQTTTSTDSATPNTATPEAMMTEGETTVAITDSGFTPKDVTIKVGETVVWRNEGTADHTVNSAVHPTHQIYPRLNLGTIKPGESKSLSFPDAGTFRFHDHLNPSLFGSVTVQ